MRILRNFPPQPLFPFTNIDYFTSALYTSVVRLKSFTFSIGLNPEKQPSPTVFLLNNFRWVGVGIHLWLYHMSRSPHFLLSVL